MATLSSRIVFYDIPRPGPSKVASPSPWKTRFEYHLLIVLKDMNSTYHRLALNFKGLSYTTVWVEYPDIKALCISIGAAPTSTKASGEPHYTLPVIRDCHTGAVVSGSLAIAHYLDKTFPSTPALIPAGTGVLQAAFEDAFESMIIRALFPALVNDSWSLLGPRSADYWKPVVEAFYGKKLEEVCPEGEARDEQWKIVQKAFADIASWSRFEQGTFVMGDSISWGDVVIASWLAWTRRTVNGKRWQELLGWDGGKWEQLTNEFEKWEFVDKGSVYST
jgi:glutathione S-transferase